MSRTGQRLQSSGSGSGANVNTNTTVGSSSNIGYNTIGEVLTIDQLVHQDDWVSDSERYRCHVCTRNFNSFRRKHHCRRCGEVVCRNCTLYKEAELPVIGRSRIRVCMSCILAHANNSHQYQQQQQIQMQQIQMQQQMQAQQQHQQMIEQQQRKSTKNDTFKASVKINTATDDETQWVASHLHSPTNKSEEREETESQQSGNINGNNNYNTNSRNIFRHSQQSFDYPLDYNWEHPWPKPPIVPGEEERLAILESFEIMDTSSEDVFDIICELASNALKCPISAVSLIDEDRQWFKASIGIAQHEIPRNVSFCAHTIMSKEPVFVLDTKQDIRFQNNPLVTGAAGIRFYGAAPICTSTGHILGTVFVFDTQPHDSCDVATLEKLSNVAMKNLEDRKNALVTPLTNNKRTQDHNTNKTHNKRNNTKSTEDNDNIISTPHINGHENSQQQIVTSQNQIATTGRNGNTSSGQSDQIIAGAKMESMLMDLLCRTTETQQQLATQQGAMFQTLGQHTAQINKLADAVARMEAKLDGLESDVILNKQQRPAAIPKKKKKKKKRKKKSIF